MSPEYDMELSQNVITLTRPYTHIKNFHEDLLIIFGVMSSCQPES